MVVLDADYRFRDLSNNNDLAQKVTPATVIERNSLK